MKYSIITIFYLICINSYGQVLPSGIVMKDIEGGVFIMGSNNLIGSPEQQLAAPEHEVTLSPFTMSEAEITNAQYVEFLNAALADGLIQIVTGSNGPDAGKRLIQGTSSSDYFEKVLYTLDGSRVLKDHDNADGDDNEFTGDVEPENPLNISYIGFDNAANLFYVKNPFDVNDFHWENICDYQDYGTIPMQITGVDLNDFEDWAGAGQNLSNELMNWTETDPGAAVNLPTLSEVSNWPVTFIRWWGAYAFAAYYNVLLPTEAQWEFAAKAGNNFTWATYNGTDTEEANWNMLGLESVATGHVRQAISGTPNPFGLYNLGGNAWEWIADHYVAPYDLNPVTDPLIEVVNSTTRCWRGGSWNYHEATLQSSIRFFDEENRGNDHFGFRITGISATTSTDEINTPMDLSIYPNPTSDIITIKIAETTAAVRNLEIYSADGSLQQRDQFTNEITLDIDDWESGVYLIKVEGLTRKFIKY